jgi:hypothetical protein
MPTFLLRGLSAAVSRVQCTLAGRNVDDYHMTEAVYVTISVLMGNPSNNILRHVLKIILIFDLSVN